MNYIVYMYMEFSYNDNSIRNKLYLSGSSSFGGRILSPNPCLCWQDSQKVKACVTNVMKLTLINSVFSFASVILFVVVLPVYASEQR